MMNDELFVYWDLTLRSILGILILLEKRSNMKTPQEIYTNTFLSIQVQDMDTPTPMVVGTFYTWR